VIPILIPALLPGAILRADIVKVIRVDMVARLTGPGAMNNTASVGIGGTDLGIMVNHNGRTFFLFGDTFSGDTPSEGGLWRWNTVAYTTDVTAADGITFDGWITDGKGLAREVIHSGRQNPVTEIPTGAISVGNRLYVWYMSVSSWGSPGVWTVNYGGLGYSENNAETFTIVDGFAFPGTGNFCMIAASARDDLPAGQDDSVYVWGTPAGRYGGVKLARVPRDGITNMGAYQYFGGLVNGYPTWVAAEAAAPAIVPPAVGEMSVVYNKAAQVWTMLYINQNRSPIAIELRQARKPWGPWSQPLTVTTATRYPGLYGSYMNPVYTEVQGTSVYFTMSLWDSYDVYLMKVDYRVVVPPDVDSDGDVDLNDFSVFQGCFNGPNRAPARAGCSREDFDGDTDVDMNDFAILQSCFHGPNQPPACR